MHGITWFPGNGEAGFIKLDPYFPNVKPSTIKSAPGAVPDAGMDPPVAV
jgi:hypothetical protein